MEGNEWKPLDGEPDLFKMFGRWDKRSDISPKEAGSGSLVHFDNLTDVDKEKYTKYNKSIQMKDIGDIFLSELKKHHNIQEGFSIKKIQDLVIKVDDSNIGVQLLTVYTPWDFLKWFTVYSPIDDVGFAKFAAKIRGTKTVGVRGTMDKPQPFWSWDSTTVEGLDDVPVKGPPVLVEINGFQMYDYLSAFFNSNKFKNLSNI